MTYGFGVLRLKEPKIGVRVCEVYLLPHLEVCDKRPQKLLTRPMVLKTAVFVCLEAEDFERTERAARMLLAAAPNGNVADFARVKLAQSLHGQKRLAEAIAVLKQIDTSENSGLAGAARFIPQLEAELERDAP